MVPHKDISPFLGDRKLGRGRRRVQIASTSFCSLRATPWAHGCQARCLSLRPTLWPLPQKDWVCFSVYLCSALGVVACQEPSLQLLKSHGIQEHELPLASRAKQFRGIPQVATTKSGASDTTVGSSLGHICSLEGCMGRLSQWHLMPP